MNIRKITGTFFPSNPITRNSASNISVAITAIFMAYAVVGSWGWTSKREWTNWPMLTTKWISWLVQADTPTVIHMDHYFRKHDPDLDRFSEPPWHIKVTATMRDISDKRYDPPLMPDLSEIDEAHSGSATGIGSLFQRCRGVRAGFWRRPERRKCIVMRCMAGLIGVMGWRCCEQRTTWLPWMWRRWTGWSTRCEKCIFPGLLRPNLIRTPDAEWKAEAFRYRLCKNFVGFFEKLTCWKQLNTAYETQIVNSNHFIYIQISCSLCTDNLLDFSCFYLRDKKRWPWQEADIHLKAWQRKLFRLKFQIARFQSFERRNGNCVFGPVLKSNLIWFLVYPSQSPETNWRLGKTFLWYVCKIVVRNWKVLYW